MIISIVGSRVRNNLDDAKGKGGRGRRSGNGEIVARHESESDINLSSGYNLLLHSSTFYRVVYRKCIDGYKIVQDLFNKRNKF